MVSSSEKISLGTWADWLNLRENAFVTAAHKFIDSNQSTEEFDISELLEMIPDVSSDYYRIVKDTFGENPDVIVDIIDQTKNAFQEFQSEYLLIQHLYRIYKQKRDLYKISMEENSKVMRGKLYKEMREPFKTVCGKMAGYQMNNNISLSNETMLDLLDEIVVSPRLKHQIQTLSKVKPIVDLDIHQLMIERILPSYGLRNDSYQLQKNRQLWSDKYPTKVSNFLEGLSDVDQLLFEIVNKYIDRSMAITVDHLDDKQKNTALELIRLCQQLMLDIKRRHPINHDHRSDLVFREDIKKSLADISKLAIKGNLDHIDENEILFQCESCIWDSSSDNWKWTINTLMALFLIGSIAICYINPPIGIGLTILVLAIAYKIKSNRDPIKQKTEHVKTQELEDEMDKLKDIINTIKQDIDLLGNVQLIIGEKTNVSELDAETADKINAFFEQSDIRLIDEDGDNAVDINLINDSINVRFSILKRIANKEITCKIKQPDEALNTNLRPGLNMN